MRLQKPLKTEKIIAHGAAELTLLWNAQGCQE